MTKDEEGRYPMATDEAVCLWRTDPLAALDVWKCDKQSLRDCTTFQEMWQIAGRWFRIGEPEERTEDNQNLWEMLVINGIPVPAFIEAMTSVIAEPKKDKKK